MKKSKSLDQTLNEANSLSWEDMVVQFAKIYSDSQERIEHVSTLLNRIGTQLLADDSFGTQETTDGYDEFQSALEILREDLSKLEIYNEKISQKLLVEKPSKWSDDEKKQYIIQLLRGQVGEVK